MPHSIKQNLSDIEYHASPAIGSTTAKIGIDNEPLLAMALLGKYKQEDKAHFVSGRLAHMAVLEPARFNELVIADGPINERTGNPYGRDTLKFQVWKDQNPDVTMVDKWIYDSLETMPVSVRNIFSHGAAEESYFHGNGKYEIKCRPDWTHHDKAHFYDLKTIATKGGNIERAIDRQISNLKYWFSLAWYRHVIELVTGKRYTHSFIFVEKEPPHRWRIVDIDFDYIALGGEEVKRVMRILDRFYDCAIEQRQTVLRDAEEDIYHQSQCPSYLLWDESEGDE